ncbi:hypothetical protein [Paraburkholderia kururiensis]|uniref:Uncharacterized protein n=1 Tax=Paraburkholderia kururiensis TaxID=984307 RepID=A0ABZ0WQH9_9BURK|nr:hypothetical protein [Paraburkholderia kururiensis]WQD79622.1 hypothetical protein U0042_08055 [Paraburkholderia kururiensis]
MTIDRMGGVPRGTTTTGATGGADDPAQAATPRTAPAPPATGAARHAVLSALAGPPPRVGAASNTAPRIGAASNTGPTGTAPGPDGAARIGGVGGHRAPDGIRRTDEKLRTFFRATKRAGEAGIGKAREQASALKTRFFSFARPLRTRVSTGWPPQGGYGAPYASFVRPAPWSVRYGSPYGSSYGSSYGASFVAMTGTRLMSDAMFALAAGGVGALGTGGFGMGSSFGMGMLGFGLAPLVTAGVSSLLAGAIGYAVSRRPRFAQPGYGCLYNAHGFPQQGPYGPDLNGMWQRPMQRPVPRVVQGTVV